MRWTALYGRTECMRFARGEIIIVHERDWSTLPVHARVQKNTIYVIISEHAIDLDAHAQLLWPYMSQPGLTGEPCIYDWLRFVPNSALALDTVQKIRSHPNWQRDVFACNTVAQSMPCPPVRALECCAPGAAQNKFDLNLVSSIDNKNLLFNVYE